MTRRRKEFSATTKREALERSGGLCEAHRVFRATCLSRLKIGNVFYEHVTPDAIDGPSELANCACLCKTHWRLKTDTIDRPMIAKAKQQRDRANGIKGCRWRPLLGTARSGWKHFVAGGWARR